MTHDVGVRGMFRDDIAKDVRLARRAIRERWDVPPRAYKHLPEVMTKIAEDENEDTNARINATRAVAMMHGQNIEADKEDEETAGGFNLTVNQYASDGGSITNGNKAALDAAAAWFAAVADDAGESSEFGVVCDEGEVPRRTSPETVEPEAP
jgi:hypothetical protein